MVTLCGPLTTSSFPLMVMLLLLTIWISPAAPVTCTPWKGSPVKPMVSAVRLFELLMKIPPVEVSATKLLTCVCKGVALLAIPELALRLRPVLFCTVPPI